MNPTKSLLSALLLCAVPAGHAGGIAEEAQKLYSSAEQKSFSGPEDFFTGMAQAQKPR